jgi:predicted house-cleaning noncanonical NTP pyrophosphatase (MazG superfamily)
MSDSPFVGPRPFEKEDSDRFFGRTRETEELLSLIIAHRAVLVYAQSGAGKSSLLRAGVINRLEEQQYQVLRSARVHGLLPNDVPPESVQNIFVYHALQYWAATLPSGQTSKDHAKTTLSEFLRLVATSSEAGEEGSSPLIVIFDQFEEFFTTNAHRWQERQPFFDQLVQALRDLPTMKVVFVMREEYIAQLEPFAELLPEKLRPRMHLERLRGNAARSAVVKPFQSWGLSFDPNAADELMQELSEIRVAEGDKFRETRGEFVEPVQLQVVCQSLWENLPAEWKNGPNPSSDGSRVITAEYIERFGDVDNALACYYDRSVERASAASEGRIGEGELRRWFGTALITPTGTRGLAFRGAPGAPWRIPGLALRELEEAHVIRREDRSGTITHELTHDRFIEPIQKSNRKWLARYQDAERVRAKLEEYVKRESDEFLDEVELREAEEYLNSPEAKILGASPEARQLVRRSRNKLEETKRRQAEELEEARQRAQQQEQVVKLLRRQRVFGIIVLVLGVIVLLVVAALGFLINEKRKLWKQTAGELSRQRQAQVEKAQRLRENIETILANKDDPTRGVTALRNLAVALNLNPQDTQAAEMAAKLLLQRVWCPPAAPEARYRRDTLLAATFAPGGNNNEVFAAAGDGQLLFWNGQKLSPVLSLFEKPQPSERQIVQPAFASFSPDGQWLFIVPSVLASAANAGPAEQGVTPQGAGTGSPGTGPEPCELQIWRWSAQKRTYESAAALKINRLRGARTSFNWAPESDRVVLISARATSDTKCNFFELEGKTFQEVADCSTKLTEMKVVALAFSVRPTPERPAPPMPGYENRNGIAVVSVDSADPALRTVSFIGADDLEVIPKLMNGEDSIRLSEGFQPTGVAFGPRNNELTLTSWSGIRILNPYNGNVTALPPPTFRDQFMRIVFGPGDFATRLVVKSLYGRVEVARGTKMGEPAEPAVFGGSIGVAQFSLDGQRLLILSGGIWNVFDRMRLIDVSPLYRREEPPPIKFQEKSVPPWLADIAGAVSALDSTGEGSLLTLETVKNRYPKHKTGDFYEAVWKHFFPDEQ